MVLGVLGFIGAGLALPLYVGLRPGGLSLSSAASLAAGIDSYDVTSPIRLLDSPRVTLERGRIAVSSAQRQKSGTMERLALLLGAGSGQLTLEDAILTVELPSPSINAPAAAADHTPDVVAPLVDVMSRLSLESLAVRRGTVQLKTKAAEPEVLSNLSADLSVRRRSNVATSGTFNYRGQTLAFDTSLMTSTWRGSGSKLPFKGTLRGDLINASIIEGRIILDGPTRLSASAAEVTSPDLRQAARWLGSAMPAGDGFRAFQAKGRLEWFGSAIAMDQATYQMDGNTAQGALTLSWSGQRPIAEGTLALAQLDLTPYAASALGATTPLNMGTVDVSFVQYADADLRLSADSIKIADHKFGRGAASVSIVGGKLLADVAELEINDKARATGQFTADMKHPVPRFGLRGKLENGDVGAAVNLIVGHAGLVQGQGTIAVDLASTGTQREQVLAHVSGKVLIGLPTGGRVAADLPAAASLANGTKPEQGWANLGRGTSSVDTFDARLMLAGRKLAIETLKAKSGGLHVNGNGKLDLDMRTMDVRLGVWRGELLTAAQMQAAPVPTLQISGPLTSPTMRPGDRSSKANAPPPSGELPVPATATPPG